MANEVVRLFVSSVSDEFGSCRVQLHQDLTLDGLINVIHQEGLVPTGTDTLLKLDDHVQLCDAVVYLAGDQIGGLPKRNEVPDLLQRYPDCMHKLRLVESDLGQLTRTQWETLLAVYHGKGTKARR